MKKQFYTKHVVECPYGLIVNCKFNLNGQKCHEEVVFLADETSPCVGCSEGLDAFRSFLNNFIDVV